MEDRGQARPGRPLTDEEMYIWERNNDVICFTHRYWNQNTQSFHYWSTYETSHPDAASRQEEDFEENYEDGPYQCLVPSIYRDSDLAARKGPIFHNPPDLPLGDYICVNGLLVYLHDEEEQASLVAVVPLNQNQAPRLSSSSPISPPQNETRSTDPTPAQPPRISRTPSESPEPPEITGNNRQYFMPETWITEVELKTIRPSYIIGSRKAFESDKKTSQNHPGARLCRLTIQEHRMFATIKKQKGQKLHPFMENLEDQKWVAKHQDLVEKYEKAGRDFEKRLANGNSRPNNKTAGKRTVGEKWSRKINKAVIEDDMEVDDE